MTFNVAYKRFGERAILVEWPATIDEIILKDILRYKASVESKNIESIVEIKLAYNSLLIIYTSFCRNYENEVKRLESCRHSTKSKPDIVSTLWKIPVCYDAVFGVDLETISKEKAVNRRGYCAPFRSYLYRLFYWFFTRFLVLGRFGRSTFYAPKGNTTVTNRKRGCGHWRQPNRGLPHG